jgi:C4-dicarboxylate-specific signal transduction histidine kinase
MKKAKILKKELVLCNGSKANPDSLLLNRLSSIGLLTGGIAHEVNNTLTIILCSLENVSNDMIRLSDTHSIKLDHIQSDVQNALEGALQIKEIVGGLRDFLFNEEVELSRVDIVRPVEKAIDMAFNAIKSRARLVKDLDKLPMVMATEGRLFQVFLNLILNALHALSDEDEKQNEIYICAKQEEDEICVEVRDTGKGILEDNLDKIFEPFYTTKEVCSGCGLGLAISKDIIKSFGGRIEVESQPGVGTSFFVYLPNQKK